MGTLIHHNLVLTSARCAEVCTDNTVLIGGTTIDNGTPHNITKRVAHPKYESGLYLKGTNDIAIIKLKCSSSATPIKLNFDSSIPRPRSKG
jgi:Trypsin